MNIATRCLLVLCAILFIFISSLTMIVALRTDVLTDIYYYLNDSIGGNYYPTVAIIIVSLFFLLLAIMFLVLGLKTNKDKKYVSKHTNMGEVKISFVTIENIIMNAAGKFNEIRNINASLTRSNEDVSVIIKVAVLPDVCIPALSEQIQGEVKNAVEESTGIIVKDVKVCVQSIYSEALTKNNVGNKILKV
mgnify:FL=1